MRGEVGEQGGFDERDRDNERGDEEGTGECVGECAVDERGTNGGQCAGKRREDEERGAENKQGGYGEEGAGDARARDNEQGTGGESSKGGA